MASPRRTGSDSKPNTLKGFKALPDELVKMIVKYCLTFTPYTAEGILSLQTVNSDVRRVARPFLVENFCSFQTQQLGHGGSNESPKIFGYLKELLAIQQGPENVARAKRLIVRPLVIPIEYLVLRLPIYTNVL